MDLQQVSYFYMEKLECVIVNARYIDIRAVT